MAKVDLSKLLKTLRGKVGGFVFRRMPDGSIVVSSAPKKKRRDSPAQKAHQSRFSESSSFARWASKEYLIYAELAAGRPMITAYNLAVSDFFHPPVIHRILRRDGRILVHASDNVMVAGVKVTIQDEQGNLLEVGDAAQQEKDWWAYLPQVEGRHISVSAWDLPGNRVHFEFSER
jgi:hypothetical protein